MSITYQIPHSAKYYSTSNTFTAAFNVPVLGKYSFSNVAGNELQSVIQMPYNSVLLIERCTIGGNISEGNFLDAINTLPQFTLYRRIDNQIVYPRSQPVNNYVDNKEIVAWVFAEKQQKGFAGPVVPDELLITFTGLLDQTAALVGVTTIKIFVNFAIYIIQDTRFYKQFRDKIGGDVGKQVSNQ